MQNLLAEILTRNVFSRYDKKPERKVMRCSRNFIQSIICEALEVGKTLGGKLREMDSQQQRFIKKGAGVEQFRQETRANKDGNGVVIAMYFGPVTTSVSGLSEPAELMVKESDMIRLDGHWFKRVPEHAQEALESEYKAGWRGDHR